MKRSFLADENAVQDRRSRALHRFLVVTPIVLMLTVGAVGHAQKPPHASAQSDPVYDQAVLAYRERVAAVSRIPRGRLNDTPIVRQELARWREGMRNGELKAIPPIAYEDHLRDGARGEIVRAGLDLVDLGLAEVKIRSGSDPKGAAEEAIASAEVAKGMENFELQSKLLAMIPLRRSLMAVRALWPQLTEDDRRNFAVRIKDLKTQDGEVRRLAKIELANVDDYVRRQKISSNDQSRLPERPSDYLIGAVERSDREVNQLIDRLAND